MKTRFGFQLVAARCIFLSGLLLLGSILPGHAESAFFIGFDSGPNIGKIYTVTETGQRTLFYDVGAVNGINGLGLDEANRRLYFSRGEQTRFLSSINIDNLAEGITNHGVEANGSSILGADFYQGKYYYVAQGTNNLYAWDPTLGSFDNANAITLVDHLLVPGNVANGVGDTSWRLGDIFFGNDNLIVTGAVSGSFTEETSIWARYSISNILNGDVQNLTGNLISNLTALDDTAPNEWPSFINGATYNSANGQFYGFSAPEGGDLYRLNSAGQIWMENGVVTGVIANNVGFFQNQGDITNFTTIIPEPSSALSALIGVGLLLGRRRRLGV
jgi:hypothetical protein